MGKDFYLAEHDAEILTACEQRLGYRFDNRDLLVQALTHASVARTRLESNERLEFLGDAILGTVVCERLYRDFPDEAEGELTRIKSAVVSRSTCERITIEIGLGQYLLLGRGVDSQGRLPGSILAAVFESLVGAIYLDGGFDVARDFVLQHITAEIQHAAESRRGVNYKSLLQQHAQRNWSETPTYRVVDEQGPDHSKCFFVAAVIGSHEYLPAWGPSKKEAEQRAAANALATIHGDDLPYPQPSNEAESLDDLPRESMIVEVIDEEDDFGFD
ncbi:MAG: ribonuclease III [Planctomycetaceae bacterium]